MGYDVRLNKRYDIYEGTKISSSTKLLQILLECLVKIHKNNGGLTTLKFKNFWM